MASILQATNRPRAPLSELPLHQFVTQSLACSPKSSPDTLLKTPSRSRSRSPSLSTSRSRANSISVSPHKQAVLQNHRLVREGSVVSQSSPQASSASDQIENMVDTDFAVLPRRLFGDRPSSKADADDSLETSPILPRSASSTSRFSPHNVKNLPHHSVSRPSTPKAASTTPLNIRQHRPPHTSGPKPAHRVEPSPTTQRMSEPRHLTSRHFQHADAPMTPSRPRMEANPATAALAEGLARPSQGADSDDVHTAEEAMRSTSNPLLQSLPKKKHRVSPTEIAIAHEEAGAGPIASPSPRKMADYFAVAGQDGLDFASAQTRSRSDSLSNRRQSVVALQSLTDLTSKQPIGSLTLAKSGLFLGVLARPLSGWTVYEDPVPSSDTLPSQDHVHFSSDAGNVDASPFSSPAHSPARPQAPSTPNKENRIPDANFLAAKAVPIALPDRAYSVDAVPTKTRSSSRLASAAASPVVPASRKRGTGGRLSLLADAEDDASVHLHGDETLAESVSASGKKIRSRGQCASTSSTTSPTHGARKASSHQRKTSAARGREPGRASRTASSTHTLESPQRDLDAVAARTRSRTRV